MWLVMKQFECLAATKCPVAETSPGTRHDEVSTGCRAESGAGRNKNLVYRMALYNSGRPIGHCIIRPSLSVAVMKRLKWSPDILNVLRPPTISVDNKILLNCKMIVHKYNNHNDDI